MLFCSSIGIFSQFYAFALRRCGMGTVLGIGLGSGPRGLGLRSGLRLALESSLYFYFVELLSCFQYFTHFTPIFCNSALYPYPFLQETWRGNYIYCEHSWFVIILVSWLSAAECSPVEDISRNRYYNSYCKTYTENQKISYINMLTVAFDTYDRKQNNVNSVFKMRRVRNWKYRIYLFYRVMLPTSY